MLESGEVADIAVALERAGWDGIRHREPTGSNGAGIKVSIAEEPQVSCHPLIALAGAATSRRAVSSWEPERAI